MPLGDNSNSDSNDPLFQSIVDADLGALASLLSSYPENKAYPIDKDGEGLWHGAIKWGNYECLMVLISNSVLPLFSDVPHLWRMLNKLGTEFKLIAKSLEALYHFELLITQSPGCLDRRDFYKLDELLDIALRTLKPIVQDYLYHYLTNDVPQLWCASLEALLPLPKWCPERLIELMSLSAIRKINSPALLVRVADFWMEKANAYHVAYDYYQRAFNFMRRTDPFYPAVKAKAEKIRQTLGSLNEAPRASLSLQASSHEVVEKDKGNAVSTNENTLPPSKNALFYIEYVIFYRRFIAHFGDAKGMLETWQSRHPNKFITELHEELYRIRHGVDDSYYTHIQRFYFDGVDLKNNSMGSELLTSLHRRFVEFVVDGEVRSLKRLLYKVYPHTTKQALSKLINTPVNGADETLLHIAARLGYINIIALLCDLKCSLELVDKKGRTPLLTAACAGQLEVIDFLLEKGALSDARSDNLQTLFHWLAQHDGESLKIYTEERLSYRPLPWHQLRNSIDCYGLSPADVASVLGYRPLNNMRRAVEVISGLYALTEHQRRVMCDQASDFSDSSLLNVFRHYGQRVLDSTLISTMLHSALDDDSVEQVYYSILLGADLNALGPNDYSPLADAVVKGAYRSAKLLIEHGAFLAFIDREGNSLVHLAVKFQRVYCLILLLQNAEARRQINHVNNDGIYPLALTLSAHKHSSWRYICLRLLLDAGADPNLSRINHRHNLIRVRPIHMAAESVCASSLHLLLGFCATQNLAVNNDGHKTELFMVLEGNHIKSIRMLFATGAYDNEFNSLISTYRIKRNFNCNRTIARTLYFAYEQAVEDEDFETLFLRRMVERKYLEGVTLICAMLANYDQRVLNLPTFEHNLKRLAELINYLNEIKRYSQLLKFIFRLFGLSDNVRAGADQSNEYNDDFTNSQLITLLIEEVGKPQKKYPLLSYVIVPYLHRLMKEVDSGNLIIIENIEKYYHLFCHADFLISDNPKRSFLLARFLLCGLMQRTNSRRRGLPEVNYLFDLAAEGYYQHGLLTHVYECKKYLLYIAYENYSNEIKILFEALHPEYSGKDLKEAIAHYQQMCSSPIRNVTTPQGDTLLHWAVYFNQVHKARILLKHGVSVFGSKHHLGRNPYEYVRPQHKAMRVLLQSAEALERLMDWLRDGTIRQPNQHMSMKEVKALLYFGRADPEFYHDKIDQLKRVCEKNIIAQRRWDRVDRAIRLIEASKDPQKLPTNYRSFRWLVESSSLNDARGSQCTIISDHVDMYMRRPKAS